MIVAAVVFAAATVPPPRTVSGATLGTVEKFTTPGPARVCMENLMVTALPGESITLDYSGIHNGSLRLNRGTAWVKASLGEIWAPPRQIGEVVQRRTGSYLADASTETKLRYALFGRDDEQNRYHLRVWIDGPALSGDDGDLSILRRIELRNPNSAKCDVTYHFGWSVLFGQEPLVDPKK